MSNTKVFGKVAGSNPPEFVPLSLNSDGELTVNVDAAVTGPLTDTQLRATAVPTSMTDGSNVAIGATGDASTANTVIGRLKKLLSVLPASLGQATAVNSLSVAVASDQVVPVAGGIVPVSVEITRPADTTAYAAGDVVSDSTSATTMQALAVARANDKSGYIVGMRLATNKKSITPHFRVHLYRNNGATVAADNAAFKSVYADDAKRIGSYDLGALATPADTTNSDQSVVVDFTMRIPFVPKSGTQNIYVVLETLDAFTPASGDKYSLTLWIDQN